MAKRPAKSPKTTAPDVRAPQGSTDGHRRVHDEFSGVGPFAGDGEAEAIALAKELGCEVVLDDLQARRVAVRQNVKCVGLLGLLLRAKRGGLIPAIQPLINSLRDNGFFIGEPLIAEALRLAAEK